tara:strand:- start:458 stop:1117 length:660 start_codon:yes stop_codon:yes gene_type:complete
MSQLIFKFPYKKSYFKKDFYVSSNNFEAHRLIETWPKWPSKWINIFGPHGCGKTHLSKILNQKIKSIIVEAEEIDNEVINSLSDYECLIIENYKDNIKEDLFYSLLNNIDLSGKSVLVNSLEALNSKKTKLPDLNSRFELFLKIGINLPTDDLLNVIIYKFFSEKQVNLDSKVLNFILKNIERSYDAVFKVVKDLDDISLSTGKTININLVKKVLKLNE